MTISKKVLAATARALLKSAAGAAQQLESDVRKLVTMRAWDVLGYKNFSEMWEKECGFKSPTHVQVLAVDAFRLEGMNTVKGIHTDGHTLGDVAAAVGLYIDSAGRSSVTSRVISQLNSGVSPNVVTKNIPRGRNHPRRTGRGPNDLVSDTFTVERWKSDAMDVIARKADVSRSELYRQSTELFLMQRKDLWADEVRTEGLS